MNTLRNVAERYSKNALRIARKMRDYKEYKATPDRVRAMAFYRTAAEQIETLGTEPSEGFVQRVVRSSDNGTQWG